LIEYFWGTAFIGEVNNGNNTVALKPKVNIDEAMANDEQLLQGLSEKDVPGQEVAQVLLQLTHSKTSPLQEYILQMFFSQTAS
jgi:hypothetical protein